MFFVPLDLGRVVSQFMQAKNPVSILDPICPDIATALHKDRMVRSECEFLPINEDDLEKRSALGFHPVFDWPPFYLIGLMIVAENAADPSVFDDCTNGLLPCLSNHQRLVRQADRINVPIVDVRRRWKDDVPRLSNEPRQRLAPLAHRVAVMRNRRAS